MNRKQKVVHTQYPHLFILDVLRSHFDLMKLAELVVGIPDSLPTPEVEIPRSRSAFKGQSDNAFKLYALVRCNLTFHHIQVTI